MSGKHVLAVLDFVTSQKWDVPALRTKQGAWEGLAEALGGALIPESLYTSSLDRVASRYLLLKGGTDA
jgi:hypothetical protein